MKGIALAIGLAATAAVGCAGRGGGGKDSGVATKSIEQVLAAHTDSLMALPGVVGTAIGICEGAPCIRVLLADAAVAGRHRIPARLDGYPVRVEVSGPIVPRAGPPP